jgi:hypothetical protein
MKWLVAGVMLMALAVPAGAQLYPSNTVTAGR